ncbi:hypothetical protein GCM10023188_27550 [Pontibacter saemangeumensis]|uniref:Uncharacterized protein n=1 Tax=Pontibacter saemangeumensis TaxID=1084525 RepID=A0ABP8LUX5_9BACT
MGRKAKSVQKEVICSIPQLIVNDLRGLLSNVSDKPLTDIQYFGYLRILRIISNKHEGGEEGWVSIDSQVLKDTLGGKSAEWLRRLCEIGLIEFRKSASGKKLYSTASHVAMQYRYTDTFRHEEFVPVVAYRRVFINRPVKSISEKATKRLLADVDGFPEYSFLFRNLHNISIDMGAVRAECGKWLDTGAYVKGEPFTESRYKEFIRACEDFNDDEVAFNIGSGNRIWTKLLGVPSAVIKFINVKDYDGTLYQGDLISAHILLAVPLIREYQATAATPEGKRELATVIDMITSKTFYKSLSDQLRAQGVRIGETKTEEKEEFLAQVWNARDDKYEVKTPYRRAFNALYPTFNAFVLSQKADGVSAFWERVTRLESEVFNNNIVKAIMNELGSNTFLAGKYDALIYKEEDKEAIEDIMEDFISQYSGIPGMVKSTTLKEESDKKVVYPPPVSETPASEIVDKAPESDTLDGLEEIINNPDASEKYETQVPHSWEDTEEILNPEPKHVQNNSLRCNMNASDYAGILAGMNYSTQDVHTAENDVEMYYDELCEHYERLHDYWDEKNDCYGKDEEDVEDEDVEDEDVEDENEDECNEEEEEEYEYDEFDLLYELWENKDDVGIYEPEQGPSSAGANWYLEYLIK